LPGTKLPLCKRDFTRPFLTAANTEGVGGKKLEREEYYSIDLVNSQYRVEERKNVKGR
jgi:hypothetical protein